VRIVVLRPGHRYVLFPPVGLIDGFEGCFVTGPIVFGVG
jgi:hypothetical protein